MNRNGSRFYTQECGQSCTTSRMVYVNGLLRNRERQNVIYLMNSALFPASIQNNKPLPIMVW